MNISHEKAQESLSAIEDVASQTRKSVAATSTSPHLIIWGLVCIFAFIGTHFFLNWVWLIWMVLAGLGWIATSLICLKQFRTGSPTKTPHAKKIGKQIALFWVFTYAYMSIWLAILKPRNGIRLNAFICTVIMFTYVIMGLWDGARFMIWLGLAGTAATLIGVFVIPYQYYCLWMVVTFGGALLGTGLYLQLKWR